MEQCPSRESAGSANRKQHVLHFSVAILNLTFNNISNSWKRKGGDVNGNLVCRALFGAFFF